MLESLPMLSARGSLVTRERNLEQLCRENPDYFLEYFFIAIAK